MTNAFNWRGKPSIFTAGEKHKLFGQGRAMAALDTSLRKKPSTITLEGSSVYREPELLKRRKK